MTSSLKIPSALHRIIKTVFLKPLHRTASALIYFLIVSGDEY